MNFVCIINEIHFDKHPFIHSVGGAVGGVPPGGGCGFTAEV